MSNEIVRPEAQVTVFGVQARAHNVVQNTDTGRILNQVISVFGRPIQDYGEGATLSVELRFDDECGNGYEVFYITAEVRRPGRRDVAACSCLHEEITQVFPELEPLIKWHATFTDGPMHYVANACYFAGDKAAWGALGKERDLDAARRTAVWPDATDEELCQERPQLEAALKARLPALLAEFKQAMLDVGFIYPEEKVHAD